jgi:hypothetical protein
MPSDDTTTTQPPKTTTRRPGEKAGAEIREQGFALLLKGEHTRDDIAATLGVSRSSIDRWARYLGKKRSKATGARTRSQRRQNAPQHTPEAPVPAVAPAPAGALIDALVAAGEALFGTYPGLTGATFSRAPDGAVRVTYRRVIEQEFAL